MRNILMTVMLITVVVIMFVTMIIGNGGLKEEIETRGTEATSKIRSVWGSD